MKIIDWPQVMALKPCQSALKNAQAIFPEKSKLPLDMIIRKLITNDYPQYASWLIIQYMTKQQGVAYAIFAALEVIDIFEKKYPNDKRPRKAIEAAQNYLRNPTAAADAADAADAAYAAYAAAYAAAAYAAADADAAYAAYAAAAAAYAAADADADAKKIMQIKILNYGIKLLAVDK